MSRTFYTSGRKPDSPVTEEPLLEGRDFYFNEEGLMVLTAEHLLRRGYCCGQSCRHCPYTE